MLKVPYRWGGKDGAGVDCSGMVSCALVSSGSPIICPFCQHDQKGFHAASTYWEHLDEVIEPEPGDLAFYGVPGNISHVVVCVGGRRDQIIGANGGDSSVRDIVTAHSRGACVKYKVSPDYRPDLRGFRSMKKYLRA